MQDCYLWEIVKQRVTPLGQPTNGSRVMEMVPASTILDLHGLTIQDAYNSAQRFMDNRKGPVTIITGRSGEICKEFPTWAALHPNVRSCHGLNGGGAFSVQLR